MPRRTCDCCLFTSIIILLVLIGVTINYGSKYADSLKYNKLKCNITRIQYPIEIPNTIDEYNNDFIKCDCGKRCVSDMGICTKVFIADEHFGEILLQKNYGTYLSKCTFAERSCPNGEKNENRVYAIQQNIFNVVNKYKNYMEKSVFIDCYEYNDVYFLDDYNYLDETITLSVFTGLLLILICIIFSCCSPQ
jgi:hypothetical protein